jgi:hypothetical protein
MMMPQSATTASPRLTQPVNLPCLPKTLIVERACARTGSVVSLSSSSSSSSSTSRLRKVAVSRLSSLTAMYATNATKRTSSTTPSTGVIDFVRANTTITNGAAAKRAM